MSAYMLRNAMLISICTASSSAIFAQLKSLPKWEAGINAGLYIYQGDLTPTRFGSFKTIKPGFGLQVTRILNSSFSATLGFNKASLKGDEAKYTNSDYRPQRAFAFTTPLKELSLTVNYSILKSNYDDKKWEPFVFAGGSLSFVNIKRDYSRLNTTMFPETSEVQTGLAQDVTKKLPRVVPSIPAGIGVRYNLNERFTLSTASTYRFMATDYLDGFSQAANPKKNDNYLSQTVGLVYKFGKKSGYYFKCPSY